MLYNNDGLNNAMLMFQSEESEDVDHTYSKFSSCKRQPSMSTNDCIIEFEDLDYKMDSHNMKMPDKVLAFKLVEMVHQVLENQRHKCVKK